MNHQTTAPADPAPGTPEDDARRAAINRQRAQRDIGATVRQLSCCCCGEYTRGRQWHNRDTGYGVCMPCITWMTGRGTSTDELLNNYGAEGIHYGADLAQA